MTDPSAYDVQVMALTLAVCDLLATERAKFEALLQLLEKKRILLEPEFDAALQAISELPPEKSQEDWHILFEKMQERVMARSQELVLMQPQPDHRPPH